MVVMMVMVIEQINQNLFAGRTSRSRKSAFTEMDFRISPNEIEKAMDRLNKNPPQGQMECFVNICSIVKRCYNVMNIL